MRFEDFVLQLDASSRGGFRARVLKSPFGEGAAGFSLPALDGSDLPSHGAAGVSRDISHQSPPPLTPNVRVPVDIGTELFRSVFRGQVGRLFDKSRGQLEVSPDLKLRLKIKIDPSDEEAGALADLPWELLCDDETEDFIALSRQTALIRYLDVPRSSQPIPFTPPLRILAASASPHGLQPLNIGEEVERLQELNRGSSGVVEVEFLHSTSTGALREALAGDTFNVLHFMGHGTFDDATGEGMLAFEGAGGATDLVSGRAFATKLRDLRSLGVVVLNACDTARAHHQGDTSPFRGVATALVLGGIPAVVAMQKPISDRAALGFSAAFYRHLARGVAIDEALTEGRQAIHSVRPDSFEWATPVLFLRIADGNVFVARPASAPEDVAPPVPLPAPAMPQALSPASPPVSSKSGTALKLAAGAAGASLVALVLYTKMINPALNTGTDNHDTSDFSSSLTSDNRGAEIIPEPTPEKRKKAGSNAEIRDEREDDRKGSVSDLQGSAQQQVQAAAPSPEPVDPQPSGAEETLAATADLSSLSAQVVKTERREEGGVRVTVSFTNTSDLPLSVTLDTESSVLSEYPTGGSYSVLGSNQRLDLAGKASVQRAFDFPIPKLGSQQLNLSLWAEDGGRVKVAGSRITLEGPP